MAWITKEKNPITKMIAGMMENPTERERLYESRMTRMQTNCAHIKADWNEPNKMDGYWKEPAQRQVNSVYKGGYVTGSGGSSNTNSIDSAIASCDRQLAEAK
mmetsp:Transcript_2797/g.5674  ORF Transcript_2797/g.5674 Transcript_2797/m.5674 type:complete len:102 (-) Transcript_2797:44-349(-)